MALDYTDYKNCPIGRYCDWRIIASPYKAKSATKQVEECKYCKRREEYAFNEDGQMADSRKYFLAHIRDFAQKDMACYFELHPEASLEELFKQAEVKRSEVFQEDFSEKFKYAIKRAYEDKDDGITKKK